MPLLKTNMLCMLSYPKIFPPSSQDIPYIHAQGFLKSWSDKLPPRQSTQTRVWNFSDQDGLPTSPMVIMPRHMLQRFSMSSFKPHKSSFLRQLLRWLKISCIGQLWSTYSQTSWFLVKILILKLHSSFDQGLIMIGFPNRVSQWKVNWTLTDHNFLRNFPTKAHFEGNSILYNFMSHKLWPKMHHLRVMDQNIIGPSKSQQKSHLFAKKCTWTWELQWRWN